ncbi:MAG: hypothetical protein ABI554_10560 [Flavobacterium sp.]
MKTKLIIVSLFLSLVFVSCKEDKKKETPEVKKVETFDVILDAVVKKENMFILFYADAPGQWFAEERTVWLGVQGKNEAQTSILSLPEGVLPRNLSIHISSKPGQEPIKFNSIIFKYKNKSFVVNQANFNQYFTPNKYVKFDQATFTATPIEVDGKYDPFFDAKEALLPIIQKISDGTL